MISMDINKEHEGGTFLTAKEGTIFAIQQIIILKSLLILFSFQY